MIKEKKLSQMWSGIMKMELSPFISNETRADLLENMKELIAKFSGLENLNLTVRFSDISILKKKEPILLVFPNGSIFVSEVYSKILSLLRISNTVSLGFFRGVSI